MSDNINPYHPPGHAAELCSSRISISVNIDLIAFAAWPVVFGLNMIVPLLFGWDMIFGWETTRGHGCRIGVFAAAALLLTSGWALCYARPSIARRLILGSTLTAFSQLLPILQIVAGAIAVSFAISLGLADQPMGPNGSTTEFGGFVVTLLVGCILLTFAGTTGLVLGLLVPKRWLSPNRRMHGSVEAGRVLNRESMIAAP